MAHIILLTAYSIYYSLPIWRILLSVNIIRYILIWEIFLGSEKRREGTENVDVVELCRSNTTCNNQITVCERHSEDR